MILVALIPPLNMESICNAAYFVFHKVGDIRVGPGMKYRIIGQVQNEAVVQIPASFDDYDALMRKSNMMERQEGNLRMVF